MLSCTQTARDPRHLAHSLIAACGSAAGPPANRRAAWDEAQSPYLSPTELGASLADTLADLPHPLVIVLDDYHNAASRDVEEFINTFLFNLPANVHLVVVTRRDPALPLARLRLLGTVVDLRGEDLLFTEPEIAQFLSQAHPGEFSHLVPTLRRLTGGWIGGLQLLLHTLQPGANVDDLDRIVADDQHLVAFLVEELLAHQPPEAQEFLLRCSIVNRVNGPLAELLCEPLPPGRVRSLLATVGHDRLFLEPDGNDGAWFRFRPILRTILQHQATLHAPAITPADLHQRAAAWFAANGMVCDAIQHYLDADDETAAARIIEDHLRDALAREDWRSLDEWLSLLPSALIESRPQLLLARAWISHFSGRTAPVRDAVTGIKDLLTAHHADSPSLESVRAECDALQLGSLVGIDASPQQALVRARATAVRVQSSHRFARGLATFALGCALQSAGQSAEALRWLNTVADRESERIDAGSIRALMGLMFVHRQAGRYSACWDTASRMLHLATRHDLPVSVGWAHWQLGWLAYEWNELEEAITHFQAIAAQQERLHLASVAEGLIGLATALQASGEELESQRVLRQLMDHVLDLHALGWITTIQLSDAVMAIARGTPPRDIAWVAPLSLARDGTPLVGHTLASLYRIRILLAEGSPSSLALAWDELTILREIAQDAHHPARLAQFLAWAAIVRLAQDKRADALDLLRTSLDLAEPSGFCRTYLDLGPAAVPLLQDLAHQGHHPRYINSLLSQQRRTAPANPGSAPTHMLDLLTLRESEVLGALVRRLSYQEIADELYISLPTVKSHISHIYDKLGVTSRRQALARVEALGWGTGTA